MDGEIWTAAELETMTPAEQDDHFRASILRNLDDVPPGVQPLVDRVRARIEDRVARVEGRDLPNAS